MRVIVRNLEDFKRLASWYIFYSIRIVPTSEEYVVTLDLYSLAKIGNDVVLVVKYLGGRCDNAKSWEEAEEVKEKLIKEVKEYFKDRRVFEGVIED